MRKFTSLILFIASWYIRLATSTSVTWVSPAGGETFSPGDLILISWRSTGPITSPSFSLCFEDEDDDTQCGDPIWPSLSQSSTDPNTLSSVSITAPNLTTSGSFFFKMKSDDGSISSSPDFDMSSSAARDASNQPNGQSDLQQPLSSPPSTSPNLNRASLSISPSATANASNAPGPPPGTSPLAEDHAPTTNSPNKTAIVVPTVMLGLAALAAVAFFLGRKRQHQKENGGGASVGLSPTSTLCNTAPKSQAMMQEASSSASSTTTLRDPGFFNVSLNKASSNLSNVEKAVVDAIHVGTVGSKQDTRVRESPSRASALTRKEGTYTRFPPRSSHRLDRPQERTPSRDRARDYYDERQRMRAEERELDRLWEEERRAWARRRQMCRPASPKPLYPQYGYERHPHYLERLADSANSSRYWHAQESYCPRYPGDFMNHNLQPTYDTHIQQSYSLPSFSASRMRHIAGPNYGVPIMRAARSHDPYASHIPYASHPTRSYGPVYHPEPLPVPDFSGVGSSRSHNSQASAVDMEHETSLAVISSYLQPSPHIPFSSGFEAPLYHSTT